VPNTASIMHIMLIGQEMDGVPCQSSLVSNVLNRESILTAYVRQAEVCTPMLDPEATPETNMLTQ
jgi:hypothetical protein